MEIETWAGRSILLSIKLVKAMQRNDKFSHKAMLGCPAFHMEMPVANAAISSVFHNLCWRLRLSPDFRSNLSKLCSTKTNFHAKQSWDGQPFTETWLPLLEQEQNWWLRIYCLWPQNGKESKLWKGVFLTGQFLPCLFGYGASSKDSAKPNKP